MAHGDALEGKWRGNWRMVWVASTLHTTSEHSVSSITKADAHTSAASSRLNWRPRRFKWTRPFRRKTKSGFCACAITFQKQSTHIYCDCPTHHFGDYGVGYTETCNRIIGNTIYINTLTWSNKFWLLYCSTVDTGSFPCGRGVLLTTHPLLVPRSWKSRAKPLPNLWATPGL